MSFSAQARESLPFQFRPNIILPYDQAMCPLGGVANGVAVAASGTWTTANTAVAIPFQVWEPTTVVKLGWINGSAVAGNTDVAIYNAATNARLTSAGSTACAGASAWQWVNTADVTLTPGTPYYATLNHDTATANEPFGIAVTQLVLGVQLLAGVKVQAVGAVTLPDPFVPADPAAAVMIPVIGLATNTATA